MYVCTPRHVARRRHFERSPHPANPPLSPSLPLPPNKQCLDPYTPTYLAVASRAGGGWTRGGVGDGDGRVLRPLGGICNQGEEEELRNVVGERTTGAREEEWGSSRATLSLKL